MAIPVIVLLGAAIVGGRFFPVGWLLVGPLCLVWMGINAIDGDLARSTGSSSARGAVLNEVIDRFGDFVLVVAGLAVAPAWLIGATALGVFSAEIIALVTWAVLGERVLVGPMGKPDRALVVSIGAALAVVVSGALTVAYAVIAIGAAVAVVVRLHHVLTATGSDPKGSS
jgi:phosphatidylglycerophosphate synthase